MLAWCQVSTLVIPDIHQRMDQFDLLTDRMRRADRIVQLGDWFDHFGHRDEALDRRTCQAIRQFPGEKLLGNHDGHYFFDNAAFMCSGFDGRRRAIVDAMIPRLTITSFAISTQVGPYLVSHAGFTEATLTAYRNGPSQWDIIEAALDGGFDPIFGAGRARGGYLPAGGPVWLDWNEEFQHIDDLPQIVGHTMDSRNFAVRTKGGDTGLKSYCCDTGLRHVLWIDEVTGAVTVEEL